MASKLPHVVEMRSPSGGRNDVQRHLGVAVCLLAFLFQLTAPFIHLWDVSARQTSRLFLEFTAPLPAGQTHKVTIGATTDHPPDRSLHNAMVCPICQTLASLRYGLIPWSASLWTPFLRVWLKCVLVCCPRPPSHYSFVARAPPHIASSGHPSR